MADLSSTDAALARLTSALDSLDGAVTRRLEGERRHALLEIQLQAAHDDRSKLAGQLDSSQTRTQTLERVNRDIAHRLDQAMDTIRSVLKTHGA
jgi:predicted  nucleic acid-binding Zn-ribbon protein